MNIVNTAKYFLKNSGKALQVNLLIGLSAVALTSCSSADKSMTGGISDPFEGANRVVFAFNDTADKIILKPIAQGYRFAVPSELRRGVSNALSNLKSPIYFGNELLQGDLDGAGNVATRAAINSLIGVGGLFDVAGYEGIEGQEEDFGQTLGVWGVGHGPYLVAPLMGPGSFRDFSGRIVDSAMDPLQWWLSNTEQEGWLYARMGAEAISKREELLDVLAELKMGAIDYYATVRSVYVQNRASLVADKNSDDMFLQDIPDYDGQ
jgi:phospholipid-binding lipoprotein MlaA